MGNTACSIIDNNEFNLQNFTFIKEFQHDQFGKITQIRRVSNQQMLFVKQVDVTKPLAEMDIEYLKKRSKIYHPNLLKVFDVNYHEEFIENQFVTHIYIFFEPFKHNIDQEIRARMKKRQHLSEIELLLHLKNSIDVMDHLVTSGFRHGNIAPSNIFVSADGQIKIADSILVGDLRLPSHSRVNDDYLGKYKSPEFFEDIGRIEQVEPDRVFKNDVFSLGMTFMELASLQDLRPCYHESGHFNYDHLGRVYKTANDLYPKNFANVLKFMLIGLDSYRPSFADLKKNYFVYAEDDQDFEELKKYAHNKSRMSVQSRNSRKQLLMSPQPQEHDIWTTPTKANMQMEKRGAPQTTIATDLKSTHNTNTKSTKQKMRIFSPERQVPVTERPDYNRMAGMLETLGLDSAPQTKKTYNTSTDLDQPLNNFSPGKEQLEQILKNKKSDPLSCFVPKIQNTSGIFNSASPKKRYSIPEQTYGNSNQLIENNKINNNSPAGGRNFTATFANDIDNDETNKQAGYVPQDLKQTVKKSQLPWKRTQQGAQPQAMGPSRSEELFRNSQDYRDPSNDMPKNSHPGNQQELGIVKFNHLRGNSPERQTRSISDKVESTNKDPLNLQQKFYTQRTDESGIIITPNEKSRRDSNTSSLNGSHLSKYNVNNMDDQMKNRLVQQIIAEYKEKKKPGSPYKKEHQYTFTFPNTSAFYQSYDGRKYLSQQHIPEASHSQQLNLNTLSQHNFDINNNYRSATERPLQSSVPLGYSPIRNDYPNTGNGEPSDQFRPSYTYSNSPQIQTPITNFPNSAKRGRGSNEQTYPFALNDSSISYDPASNSYINAANKYSPRDPQEQGERKSLYYNPFRLSQDKPDARDEWISFPTEQNGEYTAAQQRVHTDQSPEKRYSFPTDLHIQGVKSSK